MHAQLDPEELKSRNNARTEKESRASARWGDLRLRAASTVLLVPLALLVMWFGGAAWAAAMGLVGLGLGMEWTQMCDVPRSGWPRWAVLAGVMAGFGGLIYGAAPPLLMAICIALVVLILLRPWLGLGLIYIGASIWALIWLRQGRDGFADMLFLLPVVWASDIGAYAIGRVLGGPKLAPAISPGKTWSGSLGGVVAAGLVGAAIAGGLAGDPTRAALIAAELSVMSQLGDLGESWAKRRFGVKDSGNLIPGHGGLFDRLDGVMAASFPAVALAIAAGSQQYLWR